MKHIVIMPEDCYKATSGRFKDCIVRKSSMGVENRAGFSEVRYLIDLSPEAIEQAWKLHTCDIVVTHKAGDISPLITYVPRCQNFKMEIFV